MNFLKEILNIFFPDLCLICYNNLTYNEETLCIFCRVDLLFTTLVQNQTMLLNEHFMAE
jgi:hypothetical protein